MKTIWPGRPILRLSICIAMVLGPPWMGTAQSSVGVSDPRVMLKLLDKMDSSYSRVSDYTGVFHKQERIGGKLRDEETALFKFQKPFKVYLRFIDCLPKVTETLYVEGSCENKLLIRQGGSMASMTLSLDPNGSLVMSRNRHPITEFGFGFLLGEFRRNIEPAIRAGDLEIVRQADENFNGRPATVVEGRFLSHDGRKYYCARFIVHIDKGLLLPVGNVFYDEREEMLEKYDFTDVKLNVGLTAMDFSRYNKAYGF